MSVTLREPELADFDALLSSTRQLPGSSTARIRLVFHLLWADSRDQAIQFVEKNKIEAAQWTVWDNQHQQWLVMCRSAMLPFSTHVPQVLMDAYEDPHFLSPRLFAQFVWLHQIVTALCPSGDRSDSNLDGTWWKQQQDGNTEPLPITLDEHLPTSIASKLFQQSGLSDTVYNMVDSVSSLFGTRPVKQVSFCTLMLDLIAAPLPFFRERAFCIALSGATKQGERIVTKSRTKVGQSDRSTGQQYNPDFTRLMQAIRLHCEQFSPWSRQARETGSSLIVSIQAIYASVPMVFILMERVSRSIQSIVFYKNGLSHRDMPLLFLIHQTNDHDSKIENLFHFIVHRCLGLSLFTPPIRGEPFFSWFQPSFLIDLAMGVINNERHTPTFPNNQTLSVQTQVAWESLNHQWFVSSTQDRLLVHQLTLNAQSWINSCMTLFDTKPSSREPVDFSSLLIKDASTDELLLQYRQSITRQIFALLMSILQSPSLATLESKINRPLISDPNKQTLTKQEKRLCLLLLLLDNDRFERTGIKSEYRSLIAFWLTMNETSKKRHNTLDINDLVLMKKVVS